MNKSKLIIGSILLVFASLNPTQASEPAIEGQVSGIELCPQFICGSAIFTGLYSGEVDGAPAIGTWLAAVNHEPLPEEGSVPINGGQWKLQTWVFRGLFPSRKNFQGDFGKGTLTALPGNFYRAEAPMTVTSGGTGTMQLNLLLDENSIPQPVKGTLSQTVAE